MDILFWAGWIHQHQVRRASRPDWPPVQQSDVSRLLLALAVIAAIVGLLGHASNEHSDIVASTVPSQSGASK